MFVAVKSTLRCDKGVHRGEGTLRRGEPEEQQMKVL